MKQTEILTHATQVNGWEPAVYMSCMSQNFRLFHVSNLSVRNFRIFLLMYTGSVSFLRSGCRRLEGADMLCRSAPESAGAVSGDCTGPRQAARTRPCGQPYRPHWRHWRLKTNTVSNFSAYFDILILKYQLKRQRIPKLMECKSQYLFGSRLYMVSFTS